MAWQIGKKLKVGRYTIEKILGEGGFGITYLATDTNNQYFAIKTLNDSMQNSPDFLKLQEDFLKEVQQLQKCHHSHIVKIYDFFVEEIGFFQRKLLPCMVMEYIPGEDLGSVIKKRGALPETEALRYIKQVGEALTTIHQQGLLHRDIKPQNIMLRTDKQSVILIDFGVAREFIQDKTQTHTQNLTPFFAPPEQYILKTQRGAYTDVYSLAATLYVLLTGRVPERSYGSQLIPPKHLNSSISDKVNKAIIKGMEWKPEDRPQSVQQWLKMLEQSPRQIAQPKQLVEDENPLSSVAIVTTNCGFWAFACWGLTSLVVQENGSVEHPVRLISTLAFLILLTTIFA